MKIGSKTFIKQISTSNKSIGDSYIKTSPKDMFLLPKQDITQGIFTLNFHSTLSNKR